MKQVFRKNKLKAEEGFSLLEMLIALAILSLTSLILFQSTGMMLSVSEKASNASAKIVENTIARETFKKIVGGLTPGWPNDENTVFQGRSNKFSGLSTSFPSAIQSQVEQVSVVLSSLSNGKNNLVIKSNSSQGFLLGEFGEGTAVFEYMGHDQVFYPIWPPEQLKQTGFDVDASYQKVPDLPEIIRLKLLESGKEDNVVTMWTASVNGNVNLPYRDEDTVEEYGL